MSAEISSFAMRQGAAQPWWGVGQEISDSESIETWMAKTGLDYQVQRRIVRMTETKGSDKQVEIPGYMAITRSSDNHVFQVASDGYKPIQNRQIVEFFKHYVEAGDMKLSTMGSLRDGHVVWAMAETPSGFTLAGGDVNKSFLTLSTAHDGSMAYMGMINSTRIVCMNTLRMAQGEKDGKLFKLRHTSKADVRGAHRDAQEKLGLIKKQTEQLHEQAVILSNATPSRTELDNWLYRLTQPTMFDKITKRLTHTVDHPEVNTVGLLDSIVADHDYVNDDQLARALRAEADHNTAGKMILTAMMRSPGSQLESAKGTWWGAVNGYTYYADHLATGSDDERMSSSWFGARANSKDLALETALVYASRK